MFGNSSEQDLDCVIVMIVIALLLLFFLCLVVLMILVLWLSLPSPSMVNLNGKHALVTGASKGIGRQIAMELIRRGCNVTIVARQKEALESTIDDLRSLIDSLGIERRVTSFSLDLAQSYEKTKAVIDQAEMEMGEIDLLVNNAGNSVQDVFELLPVEAFEAQIKLNYLSAVWASRAVIEQMKRRRSGHIAFVSSAAGQCAIWGYSAYAPAKFALRGFADALSMELLPFGVSISVLYPPNTNTEGFAVELRDMPEQVRLISETAGLFEPNFVARRFIEDLISGKTSTTIGLDGWMLGVLTAGATPERSLWRALTQVSLAGVLRAVMLIYLGHFNRIIRRCQSSKQH